MTQPPWPADKAAMLAQMQDAWNELQRALDGWSDAQITTPHDDAGWSVKDHLAHLIVWEAGAAAMLHKQPRYEAMGFDVPTMLSTSEDEINARIQKREAARPLGEVRAALERTHAQLVAAIEAADAVELQRGYSHFQPAEPGDDPGDPIFRWIAGNSSGHYLQHLPWMRAIAEQAGERRR